MTEFLLRLKWVLFGKAFQSRRAQAVGFFYYILCGHRTEICQRCGHPVYVVWWGPSREWKEVVGHDGGVLCIPCFDKAAYAKGHSYRWVPKDIDARFTR